MSITVVLAVGLDPWLFESQRAAWRSAGCFVTSMSTIADAIDEFAGGDFDVVLLGDTVPAERKEKLALAIRESGSHIPVVSVADGVHHRGDFARASTGGEPDALLQRVGKFLAQSGAGPQPRAA